MAFCVKSVDINAFALLGTLYELPEGYVMMVGMFQYLVGVHIATEGISK